MGSERRAVTSAAARCWRGSCYGLGFVSSAIFLIIMFWILWCYLGLVTIQTTEPQRRSIVHYSLTSGKPSPTTPSTLTSIFRQKDAWNSTTPSPQVTNSAQGSKSQSTPQRGSSRGEARASTSSRKDTLSSRTDDGLSKGDFEARDRTSSNSSNVRTKDSAASDNYDRKDTKLAVILSGHETEPERERYDDRRPPSDTESITVRIVSPSAPENRASKDADRVEVKPSIDRPKTDSRDYDGDRRRLDPLPARRDDLDDATSRARRPVSRDPYEEDRSTRDVDAYDKARPPVRAYPEREVLDRDARPVDTVRRRDDPVVRPVVVDDDRRVPYDRDLPPRRRYDDDLDDRDYPRSSSRRGSVDVRDRAVDDYDRDRPAVRDDRYRDRVDDDRYRSRPVDDRYRDDDRYRSRPRDDRYVPKVDDGYRSSADDVYTRDRTSDDRYRTRTADDRYVDDDRYRDRVPDDSYRRRGDRDRTIVDDRYRDRIPDDDRYRSRADPVRRVEEVRPRGRDDVEPKTRIIDPVAERLPVIARDDRPLPPVRDPVDTDIRPSRRRDDYDVDRVAGSRTYSRDDVPVRSRADRYDDVIPRDRDLPPRAVDRPVIDDRVVDAGRRTRPIDDDYDRPSYVAKGDTDDRYRSRRIDPDYDRPLRKVDDDDDYRSRSPVRKGDDRVIDKDRPVYIAEDRELSRTLAAKPEEVSLDTRSYPSTDDDYVRNRPRVDPKLSADDRDDRYGSSRRRVDDVDRRYRDRDDRYEGRSRGRYEDDDDYRRKGDYDKDRVEPYDRARDDRRYSRDDPLYVPRDEVSDDRVRDRIQPTRAIVDDRPVRATVDRAPVRDVYPSETGRYAGESRPPRRSIDDDYVSRDTVRVRETARPVIREKRYQDPPKPCRSDRSYPDDDCEKEIRKEAVPSRTSTVEKDPPPRPLTPKEVIEAAYRHTDVEEKPGEVFYPVFDPRVSNMTSPEVIRASERRGTVITSRKKK